jgi:hypothetical protein
MTVRTALAEGGGKKSFASGDNQVEAIGYSVKSELAGDSGAELFGWDGRGTGFGDGNQADRGAGHRAAGGVFEDDPFDDARVGGQGQEEEKESWAHVG